MKGKSKWILLAVMVIACFSGCNWSVATNGADIKIENPTNVDVSFKITGLNGTYTAPANGTIDVHLPPLRGEFMQNQIEITPEKTIWFTTTSRTYNFKDGGTVTLKSNVAWIKLTSADKTFTKISGKYGTKDDTYPIPLVTPVEDMSINASEETELTSGSTLYMRITFHSSYFFSDDEIEVTITYTGESESTKEVKVTRGKLEEVTLT